jgi:hypothetical protein
MNYLVEAFWEMINLLFEVLMFEGDNGFLLSREDFYWWFELSIILVLTFFGFTSMIVYEGTGRIC